MGLHTEWFWVLEWWFNNRYRQRRSSLSNETNFLAQDFYFIFQKEKTFLLKNDDKSLLIRAEDNVQYKKSYKMKCSDFLFTLDIRFLFFQWNFELKKNFFQTGWGIKLASMVICNFPWDKMFFLFFSLSLSEKLRIIETWNKKIHIVCDNANFLMIFYREFWPYR